MSDPAKIESCTSDPLALECARFLESHGRRFLIDFGHENVIRIAEDYMNLGWYSTEKLRLAIRIREHYDQLRWLESPINVEAGDVPLRRRS